MLVIDDNQDTIQLFHRYVQGTRYALVGVSNPDEVARALERTQPRIILLDVMMPQVDGWETLRRIQEHTGVGAIPVIMFSGQVDERSPGEAASRGAQGFIGKPFDPRSLIESTKQQLPI